MGSGARGFEGAKKKEARQIFSLTEMTLNEVAVVPPGALRVTSVTKCPPGAEPGDPIDGPTPRRVRLPYSAEVGEYGSFGLPRQPIEHPSRFRG